MKIVCKYDGRSGLLCKVKGMEEWPKQDLEVINGWMD